MAGGLTLGGGDQAELGDEAMVVGGELAVQAARKGVALQLALENRPGGAGPAAALREPWEGTAGDELPGGLGDHVVVGGRADAAEGGQVLLMAVELARSLRVPLEELLGPGPVIEESPDPRPCDEPDAELDPTRPVDAREKGVLPPPGAQLAIHEHGVPLLMTYAPGCGEQRQVVVP